MDDFVSKSLIDIIYLTIFVNIFTKDNFLLMSIHNRF